MPLPFERRWGSDRKKKDEDGKKDKRDKKKYKTKVEEQMDRQIDELSRQLTEEKHNSRRERLSVTRLTRELTQSKKECSVKDSLMRDLSKERESRLDAERRLKEALLESDASKSRLEGLQDEFSKMQATMTAVMEYQNNLEQIKQEKNRLVQKYEIDIDKCHVHISNLERENSSLTNEMRNLEAKVTHDDSIRDRALLVDRLKHLEAENNALVLENDNQREQYEHCLDEVANQVVQALLMQKDLREECVKLHNRVQELEQQNHNLKCVFDSRGVSYQPKVMPQPSFPHTTTYSSPSNPPSSSSNGSLLTSSPHPCPVSNPGHVNKPANGRLDHRHGDMYNNESYPPTTAKTQHSAPSSDNVVYSQRYSAQHRGGSSSQSQHPSRHQPSAALQGNTKMQLSAYEALLASQNGSVDRSRSNVSQDDPAKRLAGFRQHNGAANMHSIRPGLFNSDNRGAIISGAPTVKTSSYSLSLSRLRANEENVSLQQQRTWNMITSQSLPQQRFAMEEVAGSNHRTVVTSQEGIRLQSISTIQHNGHASSVTMSPKLNGHSEQPKNGYALSDKYSKPYVHAPFHYAQSLLKELKEISSSVKSFENLTIEPKPGTQQKRKAEVHNNSNLRQKLVKGQMPIDQDDSLDSDEAGEGFASMPELLDTSTSSLSSTSIETALERIPPLSPDWSDDAFDISLDDQTLDSSLEKDCDTELTHETIEPSRESSSVLGNHFENIYAKTGANELHASPVYKPHLPDCSSSIRKGQGSKAESADVLQSPRHSMSHKSECLKSQLNWPHKDQYECKVNGSCDQSCDQTHTTKDEDSLCTRKPFPYATTKQDSSDKTTEINRNCPSVDNKMNGHELDPPESCAIFINQHMSENSQTDASSLPKPSSSPLRSNCKTSNGPNLYPLSPSEGVCCKGPLICSGPWCTMQKKQMEEDEKIIKTCESICQSSPSRKETALDRFKDGASTLKRSESSSTLGSITSAKELAEQTAMAQTHYLTSAEVKLKPGSRNRSKTESCINMKPWVNSESDDKSSTLVIPTPCLVVHSPVKHRVLISKDLKETCEMPAGESHTDNKDDESTTSKTDNITLPSNNSASTDEQTSSAATDMQKLEYQKTPYENRIGSFITPSQEHPPLPPVTSSSPKSYISNPDDRPVIASMSPSLESHNRWKKSTQPFLYGKITSPKRTDTTGHDETSAKSHSRSRSLGRNESFPLSSFIKEDSIRIKKTRSLDRDTGRTPSPRRRELLVLPKLDVTSQLQNHESKAPIKPTTKSVKPTSLKLTLTNNKTKKDKTENDAPSVKKSSSGSDGSSDQKKKDISPCMQDSRGVTEELIAFRSNSIGENPYLNSVSMESIDSDNSDDWDSPCKSPGSGKKAATPLSEFLSSDSDSEEEENINFVEMWKAREASSPMKLPDWNPQKSVEEHRQKMRKSLSDSNRSSNLEKSSSLSSSTSSEQWLLNYPFMMDAPRSPLFKASSPSRHSRSSLEKALTKQSNMGTNGEDDVFIVENGLPNGPHMNKLNSSEFRKSTASSGRSSLGENSVMFDFVSSILDELNTDGVVKLEPGSPVKTTNRKMEIDRLNRDKSNALIQNGHVKSESPLEEKCNKENLSKNDDVSVQESQCNNIEVVRPVRTFSLGSQVHDSVESNSTPCVSANKSTNVVDLPNNKRTNSPSRIPKASKQTPSNFIRRITNHKEQSSVDVVSGEKEKKKDSKVKSRIPQLIRNSFRQKSSSKSSKKKDRFPKVDIIRSSRSLPGSPKLGPSPILSPKLSLSPKLNGSPKLSFISNKNDEPKLNGSASPKTGHSPHLNKSPRLCASPRMAGSPLLNGSPLSLCNGLSDSLDSLGCVSWNRAHSRDSSVASSSSFVIDDVPNVPYIDESSSSPESLSNRNSKDVDNDFCTADSKRLHMHISSPITNAYHGEGASERLQGDTRSGLDDQISPEMIEDIKQGRLASNWDSLSLGNQGRTNNHYNMKNSYSWSESIAKERAVSEPPPPPPCVSSLLEGHVDSTEQCKDEAEDEPCKVQVPLVDGDMMEDFEVDDMCGDDDTGSIRENSAQLTEKERANLLDSLFESDDSEEDSASIPHSDSMTSDSHPGEQEFLKLIGEKNKALKHHVIKHSAIYYRVSMLQVDLCTLYTRFGDKEKEALASFDFLGSSEEEGRGMPMSFTDMEERLRSHRGGIKIQEITDNIDGMTYDAMMQDDISLAGSSDQEPTLANHSLTLSDLMGDSFSSSNHHSFSSSSNSLSSQN